MILVQGAITVTPSDLHIHVSGNLACVVGTERVCTPRDGHDDTFEGRVTNVYRREGGAWKLLHRHADARREG